MSEWVVKKRKLGVSVAESFTWNAACHMISGWLGFQTILFLEVLTVLSDYGTKRSLA